MKKLIYVAILAMVFTACKKEADDSSSANSYDKRSLTYMKTIGGEGSGLQQIDRFANDKCRDFEVNGEYFYICDHINNRIKRLDKDLVTKDW